VNGNQVRGAPSGNTASIANDDESGGSSVMSITASWNEPLDLVLVRARRMQARMCIRRELTLPWCPLLPPAQSLKRSLAVGESVSLWSAVVIVGEPVASSPHISLLQEGQLQGAGAAIDFAVSRSAPSAGTTDALELHLVVTPGVPAVLPVFDTSQLRYRLLCAVRIVDAYVWRDCVVV
jgi:hypothetical protein